MKQPSPLEKHIQKAVREYLEARGIIAVHVPNGAVLAGDGRQRAMQSNALKAAGVSPGFPDLILFNRAGEIGFLEIKREGGKLSAEQIEWADRFVNWGHRWAVCRSIDDAAETLARWGWAPRSAWIGEAA